MIRTFIYFFKMICLHRDLPVGPSRPHHILVHHDIHDTHTIVNYLTPRMWICQIFNACPSENKFCKTMEPH